MPLTPLTPEERLRWITEILRDVFWVGSQDGSHLSYVSPAYETIWGRTCESLYRDPRSYLDTIHPDDRARMHERMTTRSEAEPIAHEFRIVRPDGSVRWIRNRAYPVREPGGRVLHHVGVAHDITDEKTIALELGQLADRFHLVTRATNDAIWDWDMVANTAWWNEACFEVFGYDPARTAASYEAWAERVHPDDRARVTQSFERAVAQGHDVWSDEFRVLRPDGSIREVIDRAYLLRDGTGTPVRMLGAMTDVTERRALEAQLRQAQKMEAVGQLAGGIAHDFNNVLQLLSLSLTCVEGTPGLPGTVVEPLRDMRAALERAAGLTRQLLVFGRRAPVERRPADVDALVNELARMLQRILPPDVVLRVATAPDALWILGDGGMLHQVLLNLAINARDAMPRGGTLAIATSRIEHPGGDGRRAGAHACIAVSDTGTGIEPDVLGRIFEPFFTTKGPDRGTGLGLAIAFSIVAQHDGWIDVESAVGHGTTFRVCLPLAARAGLSNEIGPARAVDGGRETILVTEDDSSVRRAIRAVLERHGYRVVEADRAASALAAWDERGGEIDLVLSDIKMPGGMDGRELAVEIARRRPGAPVVLVTGDDADGASCAASATLLQKPVAADALLATIRGLLDGALARATPRR